MKISHTIHAIRARSSLLKPLFLLFVLLSFLKTSNASVHLSQPDTLLLSKQQYEELFLKQNLLLLAEEYNINQAEALFMQAKLWPNPSLSIDEVNLWATKKQLANLDDPLPAIFGNTAKNTQFSLAFEQLIQTAGKRKKLMAVEELSSKIAKQEFEELLRNLKYELRSYLSRLEFLQEYQQVYLKQQFSVQRLLKNYERQVDNNNISQADFVRLQVLSFELLKEINDLSKERNEVEAEIKVLLHVDGPSTLKVQVENLPESITTLKNRSLAQLLEESLEERPDLKAAHLENVKTKDMLQYEKSLRVPDLTISGVYDRGGGIWPSFIGFGLAIDLPFFDRNQGAIQYAKLEVGKSEIMLKEKKMRVKAEVIKGYKDLINSLELYTGIKDGYEKSLDDLLSSYTRNFINRNIGLLAYLDFQGAYLDNKKIILESKRDVQIHLEELNHTIGKEIN